MAQTHFFVLSTRDALDFDVKSNGTIRWVFRLTQSYSLNEPYSMKILASHGTRTPYAFYTDLVKPSDHSSGKLEPILGTTLKNGNTYHELSSSFLPNTGTIIIKSLSGSPLTKTDNLTLFIQLAPTRSLNIDAEG